MATLGFYRRATVLVSKGEIRVFEEVVEEAGEFAHDGGEGDFFDFSGKEEVVIEGFKMTVVDDGGHGGHVEGGARDGAAAGDVAATEELTAVGVEGSEAEKMSGLAAIHGAEFWDVSEEGSGGDGADAFDLLKALGLGLESGIGGDEFGDPAVELCDLAVELAD